MNNLAAKAKFLDYADKLVQLLIVAFSLYLGVETAMDRHISGEEGVVLDCVRFEFWRLLLPKDSSVHGCTIDHMPLYHLFAKGIFSIFGYQLYAFRFFSITVSALTALLLYRWLLPTKSYRMLILSALLTFVFLTSSFTIQHFSFIRMYSLYALTSLLSFILFEQYLKTRADRSLLLLCLVNFLGFANYAVHILLSLSQIVLIKKTIHSEQQRRGYNVFLFFLGIYALIKAVPLIQWRVFERSKDFAVRLDLSFVVEDFLLSWSGERVENSVFYLFIIVLALSVLASSFRYNHQNLSKYFLGLLFGTITFAFILRYGLNIREVSYRYFLYIGFIPLYFVRELSQKKIYSYIFISLFLIISFNRDVRFKINVWKNARHELKELLEYTSPRTEELNREGVATDSFTYFNYYIKAVHDYELAKPLNDAHLTFVDGFDEKKVKWYILFHFDTPDEFLSSRQNRLRILHVEKFPTLFDHQKHVILMKAETY